MEHPRSPRGYTYIMTYRKVIRQLVAENVSNPLAKARRVWYNADTMLDTIFLRNQRNERKNRVKMDCLAPYGANNAERQKNGNDTEWLTSARKPLQIQGFRAFMQFRKTPLQHFCNSEWKSAKRNGCKWL